MRKLQVHKGKRYLQWEDGEPFFYLADTAWELFHRLTRQETEEYFQVRSSQGFHVIQAAVLSELDGICSGNAYGKTHFPLRDGRIQSMEPCREKGGYWEHVDETVKLAAQYGLVIGMLPCWGDKWNQKQGSGPEIFRDRRTAWEYGRWIGRRYREQENIIWILGGDRNIETERHKEIILAMGEGIRREDQAHLITFHPGGGASSTDFFAGTDFLDFHGCQSGHGLEGYKSWKYVEHMRNVQEIPCIDLESRYEEFPVCFRTDYGTVWDHRDIRANGYWNLLQGACGCVYGHDSVWKFVKEKNRRHPKTWRKALHACGAETMRHMETFRKSRPYFELIPEAGLAEDCLYAGHHIAAARGEKYGMFYSPQGREFVVHTRLLSLRPVRCTWFDPRKGEFLKSRVYPPGDLLLVPPQRGKDWAAVLDILEE